MEIIRETVTLCPKCLKELKGDIIIENNNVFLYRNCSEHGEYKFLLSKNAKLYADLDSFYFNTIKKGKTGGKITNEWVFANSKCNMNCMYCAVEVQDPLFTEMTLEEIKDVLKEYGKVKLTLTGGEPTLHENLFDFFKLGKEQNIVTQLATNGLLLADLDFCKKLKESGMYEVRLSTESFNFNIAEEVNAGKFVSKKISALDNLKTLNLKTILSPTIIKGINESHLYECMEYARENDFIAEVSVNGFTWAGAGVSMKPENMIMPDEITDLIHEKYFTCDREELFTFNKLMHLVLHLFDIRICMNTQLLIFVRKDSKLYPLTSYINMQTLKKRLKKWEGKKNTNKTFQIVQLFIMLLFSAKLKAYYLVFSLINMFLANIFHVKIFKYPSRLLPVVINTTCSMLDADFETMKHCMSGLIIKKEGIITRSVATELIFDIAKKNLK